MVKTTPRNGPQPVTAKLTKMAKELSEQERIRRDSLEKLTELGINPYPAEAFEVNTSAKEILDHY